MWQKKVEDLSLVVLLNVKWVFLWANIDMVGWTASYMTKLLPIEEKQIH